MSDRISLPAAACALSQSEREVEIMWRMLGLPLPPEGFDEDDVELLVLLSRVARDLGGPGADAGAVARPIGHHARRVATWQVLGLVEALSARAGPEHAAATVRDLVSEHQHAVEDLMLRVWRRHLRAVMDWRLGRADEEAYDLEMSVGFSDMVDYTLLTAQMNGRALAGLVRSFERLCVEVVTDHGGRIVKMLGDEVLYVTDAPEDAVLIGLDLQRRAASSSALPALRVGVATGTVTAVLGDVYGVTVNRAARLTKAARPGHLLVDEPTAVRTGQVADLCLWAAGRVVLPGLGEVPTWEHRLGAQPG